MFKIVRKFSFCAAHRLQNHPGPCANLHGHNFEVELVLKAQHLKAGMIVDFDALKEREKFIHDLFDHKTILQGTDPLVEILRSADQWVIALSVPPTTENIAEFIFQDFVKQFPQMHAVVVRETAKNQAAYIESR